MSCIVVDEIGSIRPFVVRFVNGCGPSFYLPLDVRFVTATLIGLSRFKLSLRPTPVLLLDGCVTIVDNLLVSCPRSFSHFTCCLV